MSFTNFNDAATQDQVPTGPNAIPPQSIVYVRLHIVSPQESGNIAGSAHPLFTQSKRSTIQYLDTVLHVTLGQFAGRRIYQRFNLATPQTEGQKKSIAISMAQIRALIEAGNGICPDDTSPQAAQVRQLNDIGDIEGLCFPILVGCEPSDAIMNNGVEYFCNNTMIKVISIDDPRTPELQNAGELISDSPIPKYPVIGASTARQWGSNAGNRQYNNGQYGGYRAPVQQPAKREWGASAPQQGQAQPQFQPQAQVQGQAQGSEQAQGQQQSQPYAQTFQQNGYYDQVPF